MRPLKPKTLKPETLKPKTLKPETPKPETPKPETLKPETLKPKTLKPKTLKPETLKPETLKPKTLKPETLKPSNNSNNSTMPNNIRIRPATEADLPAIHALMYELAVYEKEPEAVFTTVDEYTEDFRNGLFESHVAEMDGQVVGMTLFFMAYSSWKGKMLYLDDFVVTESHRRYGIGQMLFDAFVEEGRRRGCRLVKWQVLDWNEPALAFYRKNGAIIETGWWNVKIYPD